MAHPLDDPRAKIGRAKKRLAELDAEREAWLKSNPYLVLGYPNADKTFWKFNVHRFDEPFKHESDAFGLIIGDYVHNLRSALDQLVWKLVTVANGITPKRDGDVSFPIVSTHPSDYWERAMIKRQELTFEQALFLESYQPYRTLGFPEKNALADLHSLWNTDKHKLIPVIKVTVHTNGPIFKYTDTQLIEPKWDSTIALQGDAEIAWVTVDVIGPNPKVEVEWLPVDVVVGDNARPVQNLPTLTTIVDEIVENCVRFFE